MYTDFSFKLLAHHLYITNFKSYTGFTSVAYNFELKSYFYLPTGIAEVFRGRTFSKLQLKMKLLDHVWELHIVFFSKK